MKAIRRRRNIRRISAKSKPVGESGHKESQRDLVISRQIKKRRPDIGSASNRKWGETKNTKGTP